MGLASIVYTLLAALTAIGFVGFVYSRVNKRATVGPTMFTLFVLGVLGLAAWGIFLAALKDSLAEAIIDGRFAQHELENQKLSAKLLGEPKPKLDESDLRAVQAMKNAQRSARLFGWDWRELKPSYVKKAEKARGQTQTSNR